MSKLTKTERDSLKAAKIIINLKETEYIRGMSKEEAQKIIDKLEEKESKEETEKI